MSVYALTSVNKGYCHSANENIIYNGRSFSVGFLTADMSGRKEFQGPIENGPWAWANANATVISAHYIPEPKSFTVEDGDLIVLGTDIYRVYDRRKTEWLCNSHWLGLELVDLSEFFRQIN